MFNRRKSFLLVLTLIGLALTGCLVSGTYPIVEGIEFNFTADTGYYWYPMDLSNNADWEEHIDKLDNIEAVGFDFWIENTSDENCTFTVMIKGMENDADKNNPPTEIDLNTFTLVFDQLTVAANSKRHLTYAESLGMISNQVALKNILMSGRFDYIGIGCGGTEDDPFIVTEGKIIITVAASDGK